MGYLKHNISTNRAKGYRQET